MSITIMNHAFRNHHRKLRNIDSNFFQKPKHRLLTTALQEPRMIDGLGNPRIFRYTTGNKYMGIPEHFDMKYCGMNNMVGNPDMYRGFSTMTDINIENIDEQLKYYGNKKQTQVSLKALMETGVGALLGADAKDPKAYENLSASAKEDLLEKVRIQVACFLHRELPVRLAHQAVDLDENPLFRKSENIKNVCSWYKTSFKQLRECSAPINKEKENLFAQAIESIYDRHSATLITMAKGAHELRTILGHDIPTFSEKRDIQTRLEEFYLSRIGIRMLIGQYLALRKPTDDADMVGMISRKASPYNIALSAISDAAYMCTRQHGDAPEVQILGRTDLTFPYVPSHISYILLELLKNSMRATVETHGTDEMPPIRIVIADGEGNEDVVIKISDEGGGIRRSNMNRIWSYLFTTANPDILERMISSEDVRDFDTSSPLAGLGYGLPISRNYARYFGGDLIIMSMEGYGTDSFIYLPRLGERSSVV